MMQHATLLFGICMNSTLGTPIHRDTAKQPSQQNEASPSPFTVQISSVKSGIVVIDRYETNSGWIKSVNMSICNT